MLALTPPQDPVNGDRERSSAPAKSAAAVITAAVVALSQITGPGCARKPIQPNSEPCADRASLPLSLDLSVSHENLYALSEPFTFSALSSSVDSTALLVNLEVQVTIDYQGNSPGQTDESVILGIKAAGAPLDSVQYFVTNSSNCPTIADDPSLEGPQVVYGGMLRGVIAPQGAFQLVVVHTEYFRQNFGECEAVSVEGANTVHVSNALLCGVALDQSGQNQSPGLLVGSSAKLPSSAATSKGKLPPLTSDTYL